MSCTWNDLQVCLFTWMEMMSKSNSQHQEVGVASERKQVSGLLAPPGSAQQLSVSRLPWDTPPPPLPPGFCRQQHQDAATLKDPEFRLKFCFRVFVLGITEISRASADGATLSYFLKSRGALGTDPVCFFVTKLWLHLHKLTL